ncbi:hypothetical protein NDU88_000502 [Pleurodeles waltl]|uniref:Uncharacterized protein n=1 Tax=Pleurodeles waltl TaxID=8319 RepID=A0AAV7S8C4_PLEWA|nr:hypothetical protein NDU88_000502 [Pleurodeles waltl]
MGPTSLTPGRGRGAQITLLHMPPGPGALSGVALEHKQSHPMVHRNARDVLPGWRRRRDPGTEEEKVAGRPNNAGGPVSSQSPGGARLARKPLASAATSRTQAAVDRVCSLARDPGRKFSE